MVVQAGRIDSILLRALKATRMKFAMKDNSDVLLTFGLLTLVDSNFTFIVMSDPKPANNYKGSKKFYEKIFLFSSYHFF